MSRRGRLLAVAVMAALLTPLRPSGAIAAEGQGVGFNQTYIESVTATHGFAISDVMAVFAYVFAALPPEVRVYPTENYYYFTFGHAGVMYAGNFRLDVKDRDKGVVHFAYFNQSEDWNSDLVSHYKPLTAADGVTVERLAPLRYRLSFNDKSVLFALNDLSSVVPPAEALAPGEEYLGPVFDESGVRFYFLLNRGAKQFLFVLNEAAPTSDLLNPYSPRDPDILLGARTGFAYFKDRFRPRKILIGVYAGNVGVNNYFDGPFDQLPDNFFKPGQFADAVLTVYPELKGEIDAYGSFKNQDGRVLISPYVNYSYLGELEEFRRCADPKLSPEAFYKCLRPREDRQQ